MKWLDTREDILSWASEPFPVPYTSPIDGMSRRYFPDFIVKYKDRHGNIKVDMIEVKPFHETQPPVFKGRKTKRYIKEVTTYGINQAKWEAAQKLCDSKGWTFKVLTEQNVNF